MKATGIVRRVDDLGRIVIPKEIRRAMTIKEGDPLEIYVDHEQKTIIFKKYFETSIADNIKTIIDYNNGNLPDLVKDLLNICIKVLNDNQA